MSDPAGLALAAVFILLFAYLIPQLVKQRKIAVESRMQERYSTAPRVVAAPTRPAPSPQPHKGSSGTILTREAPSTEGRSVVIRPPVTARHAKVSVDLPTPIKLTRVQAARRRAVVAATLGALTVVGLALLATGSLPAVAGWAVFLCPAIGLVVALAMGRRAARANQNTDQEYLDRLRRRQEMRAHPKPILDDNPVVDLADIEPPATPKRPAVPAVPRKAPRVEVSHEVEKVETEVWTPVEVPKPAYVDKAKAPRWVPEPLTIADLDGEEAGMSHTVLSTGATGADGDGPLIQYTELDLDAIMERRRVV